MKNQYKILSNEYVNKKQFITNYLKKYVNIKLKTKKEIKLTIAFENMLQKNLKLTKVY